MQVAEEMLQVVTNLKLQILGLFLTFQKLTMQFFGAEQAAKRGCYLKQFELKHTYLIIALYFKLLGNIIRLI